MAKAKKANDNNPKPKEPKAGPRMFVTNGVGHNTGQIVIGAVQCFDELAALAEQKKAISAAERDVRNRLKVEFGVLSSVTAHELRLRKMDRDVRVQFESGHADLKQMLGYQQELDLLPTTLPRTEDELVDPSAPRDDIINRLG